MTNDIETISAMDNPVAANQLIEAALSDQEVKAPKVKTSIPLPPDTEIKLPGGLYDPFDGVIKTAEVRELTGADEEAIARISDPAKALLTILERAVVKIGDKPASKELLDVMLAGDREMLLLAIRRFTFGDKTEVGPGICNECEFEQTFEIDLDTDVNIKELNEDDRVFTLDCKVGQVVVSLPNGAVQKALVNATNKNSAELDTILLKGCISSINEIPIMNVQQVKDLSIKDRRDILTAITSRNPGPLLSEIKKPCASCGVEVPLPLTLAELFQG
jgi:hypothetical protein